MRDRTVTACECSCDCESVASCSAVLETPSFASGSGWEPYSCRAVCGRCAHHLEASYERWKHVLSRQRLVITPLWPSDDFMNRGATRPHL